MSRFSFPISMVLFLTPAIGLASPAIDFVHGGFDEGNEIGIAGSGFGVRENHKFVFTLPEETAFGQPLDGSAVPAGSGFLFLKNTSLHPDSVRFSVDHRRTKAAVSAFSTTRGRGYLQNPYALGGASPPVENVELYGSFWFKPDGNIDYDGHASKFMRVWDDPNGTGTRISWSQHLLGYPSNPEGGGTTSNWGSWGGNAGQWNRLELYVNSQTGRIQAWTNGELKHDISDFAKRSSHPDLGLTFQRVGFDGGGNYPPKFESFFSDIYLSNSRARVELCDAPTWDQCTVKELQPVETWGDDLITIRLALGVLANEFDRQNLYLYVINDLGQANSIGISICEECPVSPEATVE